MYYYIADTHFGHRNVITYDGRPFASVEEMNETIISRWNERVTAEDTVFVLGDLSLCSNGAAKNIFNRLLGKLVLIRGNHDNDSLCRAVSERFDRICDYLEIDDSGTRVIMCHYPILFHRCDSSTDIHLYGHVHNNPEWLMLESWKKEAVGVNAAYSRMVNVGCMMTYMDYAPRTLEEICEAQKDTFVEN